MEQTIQQYQTRITAFVQKQQPQSQLVKSGDEQKLEPSFRVKAALDRLFKVRGILPAKPEPPSLICKSSLVDKSKTLKRTRAAAKPKEQWKQQKQVKIELKEDENYDDFYDEGESIF